MCKYRYLVQVSSKFEVQKRNSIKFLDFSFKIHFESEEVSMDKIVHLFKIFRNIFYFNFSEIACIKFIKVV
jgi:hypothetical protein